jgi:hypothetical protein
VSECFNISQDLANLKRVKNGLIPINHLSIVINKPDKIQTNYLHISQIESLYNIQSIQSKGKQLIASTIFSDLKHILKITATEGSSQTVIRKNNIVTQLKESWGDVANLKIKYDNIKKDLEKIQRINEKATNSENDEELEDLTQNSIIPDENEIPEFCYTKEGLKRHLLNCEKHCYFKLEEIEKLTSSRLLEELANHGHPKSLKKKNGNFFTIKERKTELVNHYKCYHKKC